MGYGLPIDQTRSALQPSRRTAAFVAAIAAFALAVGITVWLVRATPGPLGERTGTASLTGIPADVGGRLSVGVDSPMYSGAGTVIVDSVTPDRVPGGLRVLGYRAITWGEGGVGALRSFPPPGHSLHPVAGWAVRPNEGLSIVVGLEPQQPGVYVIPGFTVRYHIGWHHYAAHYAQAVKVCSPLAPFIGHCG